MTTAAPITVLVADDNPYVHTLVRRILSDEFQIVGSAMDGEDLVHAARQLSPDVVVVDVGMPRVNGIEAVRRLRGWHPPAVVFLTSHGDQEMVNQARAAGGMGYVLKQCACEELADAIYSALRNEPYVSVQIGSGAADSRSSA